MAGQTVPGVYLGQIAPVLVPDFTRIEPYRSPDGQTEIDVLAADDASDLAALEKLAEMT